MTEIFQNLLILNDKSKSDISLSKRILLCFKLKIGIFESKSGASIKPFFNLKTKVT